MKGFNTLLYSIIESNKVVPMSMVIVHLTPELERIVGVIKGMYGISSKDKAIQLLIERQGEDIFEGELRPEFIKEMRKIEKGKFKKYKNIDEFFAEIER